MKFTFKVEYIRRNNLQFMPKIYFYYGDTNIKEYIIKVWNIFPFVYIAKGENSRIHLLFGKTTYLEKLAKACNVPKDKRLKRLCTYKCIWQSATNETNEIYV